MKKLKLFALFVSAVLLIAGGFAFTACSGSGKTVIGVCMPKVDGVDRWASDGQNIKKQLESKGYKVQLKYADDSSKNQVSQIRGMIKDKCKALIIAAADCYILNEVLGEAAAKGIKIIAYDRLIMDTAYVDYYCTFDNGEVGERQGKFIEEKLKLETAAGPFYMEIFAGAADDSTVEETLDAQMSVLKPYIDQGKLIIASGESDFLSVAIPKWSSDNAKERMEKILGDYYTDKNIDVVLSMNDSMALGIMSALDGDGYETGETAAKSYPLITGMDCDIENVKAIINGKQSMSLFIDTRALAAKAVTLVDDILRGKQPAIDNATRYDNKSAAGKPGKIVPAVICRSVSVDKDNYNTVLIASGAIKAEELE